MRITYLVTGGGASDGAEAAVLAQAAHLAERHETEIIAVFEPASGLPVDSGVQVRSLIDTRGRVPRPARDCALDELTCRALSAEPSALLPAGARDTSGLTRLGDIELRHALTSGDRDVLVGTTPALASLVTHLAPATTVTVGQDYRAGAPDDASTGALLTHAPWLDALVVPSEPARAWLTSSLGPAAPLVRTIPPAAPSGFRPRSGLRSGSVLLAQELTPQNRTDDAIRAFARVADTHPGWTLRVRGTGPDRVRLRSIVTELELHDRVEFLQPGHDTAETWAAASVCLLPCRDGSAAARAVLEAFAAGVPAVCYDVPNGPAEVVRHGTDGLLTPAGDIEALATALDRLMADETLRDTYGAAALEGLERFSPDLVTARWEALYTDLRATATDERARARADRAARHAAATARNVMLFRDPQWGQATSQVPDLAAEEERIHRQHPGLVRSAGQLTEVRDDLRPHGALQRNLELIAAALDYFGVPYALVRGTGPRHRVMVTEERSAAAMAALATTYDSEPVYAAPLRPRARLPQPVLAGMAAELTGLSGLRVFRPVITSGRTLRYGSGHGADLEFWRWDADDDCYVAPHATAIGDRLPQSAMNPASLRVANRDYPSFEPFTRRLTTDVDFPVDAVCALGGERGPGRVPPSEGEEAPDGPGGWPLAGAEWLRYALRSIAMFAPWIRRIFVVTTGPVPDWLDTSHPEITVVRRHDPSGGGTPPMFDAAGLDRGLHTVAGLGEHLVYLAGGVVVGRLLGPDRFFHANGVARFVRAPAAVPLGKPTPEDVAEVATAKRNRALVEDAFERCTAHGFARSPAPLRRSVLAEIHERFPSELTAAADTSAPVSLHHHYAYLTGRAVPARLGRSEVDAGDPDQHPELNRLLRARDREAISVTGSTPHRVPLVEQRRLIRAFLWNYFPVPSPYERTVAS
ncbi:glycosyltransferase [Halostreptopolyspora alba]|uniref:Glycosyltransferase n=1 Tax=Halostreptopolyspora alba TaxID=2487137 RepID=A0A3N0E1I1_9ACTN|nr:glycosyltransferase [Nocardiopsaceae bacterium YIM 96095]